MKVVGCECCGCCGPGNPWQAALLVICFPRMTAFPSTPRCSFSVSNSITGCCQGVAKAASFPSPPRSKGFTCCAHDLLSSCPEEICGGEGEEMCRWQEISSDSSAKG